MYIHSLMTPTFLLFTWSAKKGSAQETSQMYMKRLIKATVLSENYSGMSIFPFLTS